MSTQDTTSEAYALEKENEYATQYQLVADQYPDFKQKASALISAHTPESYQELVTMYNADSSIQLFKDEPDFAYMLLITQIYISEISTGRSSTILDSADSIEDFISIFEEAKWLLWRIEFTDNPDCRSSMVNMIKARNLSPYFITKLLQTSAMTIEAYSRLIELFANHFMLSYEYNILMLLNSMAPGNEDTLCTLAVIAVSTGKKELARSFISQIASPGLLTERTCEKYGL